MPRLLLLLALLPGCGPDCYWNLYTNVTNYDITPNIATESGIAVDGPSSFLNEIDVAVLHVESCLASLVESGYLPVPKSQCIELPLRPTPIKRECLKIKIVEPVTSLCSEWHFLKEEAPNGLCEAKGVEPSPECPCRWRWAVQDDCHLVVPAPHEGHALYFYELVKIHTGCNNYWADPELTKCAKIIEEI